MAQLTYLQIVQRVLSMVNGDEVTSISDTVESEQVAELVKHTYDELIEDFPWYHKRSTVNLEVTATPNLMKIPSAVDQILSDIIYYNDQPVYWITPAVMRDKLARRDKTLANIDSAGAYTDVDPKYWSSYDDEYIVFDSYNGNLVASYTALWAASAPTAPTTDTEVPDLPKNLEMVLLNGVLEQAFRTIKGDEYAAQKYETKYIKGKAKAKRWAQRVNKENDPGSNVNYGRKNRSVTNNDIPTSYVREG